MKQWTPLRPRLNELMFEYDLTVDDLFKRTEYPRQRIHDYISGAKANMNLATGMTFADAIGCSIEGLYKWNHEKEEKLNLNPFSSPTDFLHQFFIIIRKVD